MLDDTTKKKINTLRDILVGKVSDPKSQVEQITIALFYKFMEDMDNELINDLGAEAKFFSGEYAKYSWKNLFAPSLGGEDMLNLYREAVEEMEINPNIPSAFRDIFKRAYLPYNDPATLRMFLKVVDDGFHYANSEMLGDAFEYLLSILGTQGDAGQFRTPRHIIDFIAACVNPQKEDVICDPACGTAGFVIAAYKHILKQNTKNYSGDLLSPDDKKRIAQNLIGLDIDPMMVKLALANMYLHGFQDPHIYEYDSLTSEDRWADTYDVVLANPPFMTPKGGIRPHKRFTTQATKAEVLFVDLISTHLTANGRAGIIVPYGIVATTQTAYKDLRKLLIYDSLIAVISLPAGVFQPYSGVKTSILILDKILSKKSDSILFIKVENDGLDLGAQRREIDKNDLPNALYCFNAFKSNLQIGAKFDTKTQEIDCVLVDKETILDNRDFVLSGDRYKPVKKQNTEYPIVSLGNEKYFKIESGGTPSSKIAEYWNGSIKWATLADLPSSDFLTILSDTKRKITEKGLNKSSAKLLPANSIFVSSRATIGRVAVTKDEMCTNQGFKNITVKDFNRVNPLYVAYCIKSLEKELQDLSSGSTFKEFSKSDLSEIQIPLPPLQIQEQIVAEIEGFQKIIDGAKMVVENYKPIIYIKPDWEMVALEEICKIQAGGTPSRVIKEYWENGTIPWVGSKVCKDCEVNKAEEYITEYGLKKSSTKLFSIGTTLIALVGATIGKTAYLNFETTTNQNIAGLLPLDEKTLDKKYLYLACQTLYNEFYKIGDGGFNMASLSFIKKLKIPFPSIKEQQAIVDLIEVEQKIVNANKQLIEIYEQKIQSRIAQVWGEE